MDTGSQTGFLEILRDTSLARSSQPAFTFLDGAGEAFSLSYSALDRCALALAALFQQRGHSGQRALLLYPPGLDFIKSFLGCLYSGVIAVPTYPPNSERNLPRLLAILQDARPALVLTTSALLSRLKSLAGLLPGFDALTWVATDEIADVLADDWRNPHLGPEALAFLQYTSGSTALPKGVMVSHGNLLHNEEMIRRAFGQSAESVIVGWLPLYHDMGLIGNVLQPLYLGAHCILQAPAAFLQRPFLWLEAISRYRATTSGGPNFAYDLCVRKIYDEQRAQLDLSSWEVAFNGAEPVRPETLERFANAFAPQGFRRAAFYPCYGLAEATLFVSGGGKGIPPVVASFDGAALERHEAVPVPGTADGHRRLVGCGRPWQEQSLAIVDPESSRRVCDGKVGEIWVAGPSVAQGYRNRPEATEREFRAHLADSGEGPFLRTGDLGFLRDGELFVTGRLKDLLILRGRNIYPQDIERTLEQSHEALRRGCGAAFAVEVGGEERLVVVQELDRHRRGEADAVLEALRQAVAEEHEVQIHQAVLVRTGTIPKTSSGKIQRHAARAAFLAGTLAVQATSALQGLSALEATGGLDREALLALPEAQQEAALRLALRELVARATRISPAELREDRPLTAFGLDSLGAIEIQHEMESVFGVAIDLAELLRGITLQQLAAQILAGLADQASSFRRAEMTPVPSVVSPEGAPLSHGQRALWFLQRLQPSNAAYNIAAAADVRSPLDPVALRRALELLTWRHEALRYSFAETAAGPVQRVCPGRTLEFHAEDAIGWTLAQLDARLRELADRPFDLEEHPLLRVAVFQTSAGGSTLLLVVHHIVADLWSLALLVNELGELYPRMRNGGAGEPLTAPALRYTDYVAWQEHLLAGERGEALWAYWREQLRGELPSLDLPCDRPRPHLQTFNGGARSLWLPIDVLAGIRSLGTRHDATLYTPLLTAYQVLLHRYSGQEDVLVGSPIFGRASAGFADLVGYFVNPVVLRSDLSGQRTLAGLLAQVRGTVLEAFGHQDYPFPLLVERLQPERDLSRSPLFQALFVMERAPLPGGEDLAALALGEPGLRVELGGLALESRRLERSTAQLDLELLAAETPRGLGLVLVYNSDLFDATTAERVLGHLRALIAGAVDHPERLVAELPLLEANERAQLLLEWNDTGGTLAEGRCLHELFVAQATATPGAAAVVCDGSRLTYGEIERRANQWARHLRALGVGAEVPVGVCLERGPELVPTLLGILKAGGAYLPLDPAYPEERLATILEDARVSVLVTQASLAPRLSLVTTRVLVDVDQNTIAAHAATPLERSVDPGQLAYLIYTSGSTGRPKGVAITHRSAVALVRWAVEQFSAAELAGVLASTSICFDLSVFELFVPLCQGGTVLLAADALALAELPAASEVTLINTVPSAIAELVRLGPAPPGLRTVSLAGEPLSRALVQQVERWHPGVRVLNLYGPSESTTYSTWAAVAADQRLPPIGRPVAGTSIYLLDRHGIPVPLGVPGELHIAGAGLARGYFGRPELTAAKFIPDPFAALPGGRLYATGDIARLRPDGNLEFLGRIDHQVKIRGFRIELGEVEAVLVLHPAVEAVAVVPQEASADDRRLVAYVVGRPGEVLPLDELREIAARRLPGYMVPAAFMALPALPLTPNGKLDRRALPRPDWARGEALRATAMPSNALEELLVGLWAELLGLDADRVGVDSNFFNQGGHSLLATRLISRVRADLRVDVPLRSLFQAPTPAGLARLVQASQQGSEAPPIRPVPRSDSLPLSFAQERLWFLDQLEPEGATYNIPAAVRLEGRLNTPALAAGLQDVVRRHEALRTTFAVREGRPVQRIAPPGPRVFPEVDLSGLEEAVEVAAEASRLAAEESRRSFDLTRGPLWRATLLRLSKNREEHLLLLTLHHIVADGWSIGVFARELSLLYAAFAVGTAGQKSPLPELPIQYADFACWQREWMSGEILEGQLTYWRGQLAGAPVLELPSDRPPLKGRGSRGASLPVRLPHALTRSLGELARREGFTLFMVLVGGFVALLSRRGGQEDVSIGTAIANRNRAETEDLIGFVANTLVLRTNLAGDPSGRDLLARVREVALSAYAHQDLPFERLVQELQSRRDAETSPLFRVALVLGADPSLGLALPGLIAEPWPVETGTAKFDLTLQLSASEVGLKGTLEYSVDLFTATTVARLAGHLQMLLAGMVDDLERRLSELPLLTLEERAQLLAEWPGGTSPYARDRTVHELFAEQAQRRPEAVAVTLGSERLTYGELERGANRLAHSLIRLGVGPEVRVGLYLDRSPELVVALMAVLKSGGAYVPLDPGFPQPRLAFILAQSGAPLVLTREGLSNDLPDSPGVRVLCLDVEGGAIAAESAAAPTPASGPENLAYVMYTSGSTGEPKGVSVTHRSIVRLVRNTSYASFGPDEVLLQAAPLAFDASTFEIWGALLNGGRLVLLPPGPVGSEEIAEVVAREGVTTLWLTAGLFHALVEGPIAVLRGLRQLLAGGDVLSPPHVRRALAELPGCVLINGYGPTENTTFTCCHRMLEPQDVSAPVSLGRPIANTSVYVVDPAGNPCPVGVPGELRTGGDGLARGYFRRPDLTAERFLPDPFGAPGARLYSTGDLARYRPDGTLEFLGRLDQQLKIRGFRIEPGELEVVLASLPGVEASAVLAHEAGPGDHRLVAYVTPRPGWRLDFSELCNLVAARLPAYMVPAAFVELADLPLTANGKLDRRALRAPDWTGGGARRAVRAPRDPSEELLVRLWAELLGLEPGQVSVDDDFFELGGHSLLATRLASRIREDLRLDLPLRSLFDAPTPAALARLLAAARQGPQVAPILPLPRAGGLPLSFAQERLWFLDQLEPGSALYNIAAAERLAGPLDRRALAAGFDEIVRRHEALRTTFAVESGAPLQRLAAPRPGALPEIDLRGLAADLRLQESQRLLDEESQRGFDLERGPLLRTTLVHLATEESLLLLTLHHIVADGWSMGILVRELSLLYADFAAGRPPSLPELVIQYADVAVWQRQLFSAEALAPQLAYWKSQLAGAPVLQLPTDRPPSAVRGTRGASLPFVVSGPLTAALAALARRERATLFMALLCGFQAFLSRHADQDDIVVGTVVANRQRGEMEGLIGFFVNTLVLRTDLAGDPEPCELLRRVRAVALDAYAHQDLPFEKLVEELAPERDLSRTPLIRALLVLQSEPLSTPDLPGIAAESLPAGSRTAKFDLTLSLVPEGAGLSGALEYATELFDAVTIQRLASRLERLLIGLAEDAAESAGARTRLSSLPLLAPGERMQLLGEWSGIEAEPGEDRCLHELVAAQADANPAAVAVVCGAERLTYRELNEQANRLAHHLRTLGVAPETPVGVCLERGPLLVPALLGILKAGGAYVPLDPAYPAERLALVLADSRVAVLVTQASLAPRFAGLATCVILDTHDGDGAGRAALASRSPLDPQSGVEPSHLAYLIYTSGSTGRPKGVAITHRSAAALVRWATAHFCGADLDGVLAATSIAFDLSIFEIFAPLSRGGKVLLAADALALAGLPAAAEVTLINTVPSAMAELVRLGAAPPGLRVVNLAGEALQHALVRAVEAWHPGVRVFNLYGPSEDTTYSTWTPARGADERPPAIGRPIAGTSAYLLDRHLEPLPPGAPGALYLGGDGLARGYFGQPELTAERFIPDPFARRPGGRLYATGDLARFRSDGDLEFLGRRDQQVKIRGFRIELGEIEAVLAGHPAVREVAVLAHRLDSSGETTADQRLVAYVTLQEAQEPVDATALRAFLGGRLPAHMVPGAFAVLPALPLLPNGKVDRRALATRSAPAPVDLAGGRTYAAPRSPLEELTADIMGSLLGVERVGIEESFFDLGGHSLLATRLVSQLRESLGVIVPVRQLFETPTVAGLAAAIERHRNEIQEPEPPIVPVPRGRALPLASSQERLWFLDKLQPGSATYNMPVAVRLRGPLQPVLLAHGLNESVRRHEILRTTFGTAQGEPFQHIAPDLAIPLPLVDLSGCAEPAREADLKRWMAQEGSAPFDLETGPLLRARLFRFATEDWVLLLNLHHIVTDGWSMQLLIREVARTYAAAAAGEPSPLPPLAVQYADFALWQQRWLRSPAVNRHISYWRQQLCAPLPVLDLPTDRLRPPIQTFRGGSQTSLLPHELGHAVRALGREHGATLFMSLHAVFNLLLHRYSRQDDLLVGIPIAGRNRAQVEELIGFFVNSLVLRTDLSGQPCFAELLGRVRRVALDAYTHQDLPFERLLQELQPERDLSRTPLFQVYFNFQTLAGTRLVLPELSVESITNPEDYSKFDLTLYVLEQEDGSIRLDLVYNAGLFDPARCREMLSQYTGLLAQVVARPLARIDHFSLLTHVSRQILADPTRELDASWIGPVHSPLSEWAAREPSRPAVTDSSGTWSYAELEAQSNRLAHRLRGAGVGRPGEQACVAIYAQRSATLVWAVLGVLKAGAAFVVLDPAYPAARIIETLRLARPMAWLQMEAAGAVPEDLAAFVADLPDCLRLALPPWRTGEVGAQGDGLADQPATDPGAPIGPDDLAYIAFTSGSTGAPKGILGRHGPLSHFLPWQREEFGLSGEDRFSLLSGLAHDPLQRDLFTPLYLGATICVPDPAEIVAPGRLSSWMRREGVSVAHLTPAMGQLLAESADENGDTLPALRYVFLVGDILTLRDVARLRRLAPGVTCVNLYGSTETQRAVGYHVVVEPSEGEMLPGERRGKEVLPLGRGMKDVQLLVLNGAGELAGIGELGEISVRSPHLARGYLGDVAGTAERFVENPLTRSPGDRLYRTGDLGRYLPNGEVSFAGRADTQVKIRGFRIELGEIEAQLGRIPGVREAVVLANGEDGAERRLAAYVVAEPGLSSGLSVAELRRRLKAVLPAYMVPSAFVLLPRIPLTPNGKIDRRALHRLETPQPESEGHFRAPQTRAEVLIAAVLRQVLGVERVGVDDNFFDLGGNSLLLVKVQSRLQAEFQCELPVFELFSNPTVASLARHLAPPAVAAAAATDDSAEKLEAGRDRLRRRFQLNREPADTGARRSH